MDSVLRTQFEFAQILRRFRTMSPELIRTVFADDLNERKLDPARGTDACLAELALTVASPAHRLFACATLFEIAQSDEDVRHLRDTLGRTDVFGMQAVQHLGATVVQMEQQLMTLTERVNEIEAQSAEFQRALTLRDEEIGELRGAASLLEAETNALRHTNATHDREAEDLKRMIADNDAEAQNLERVLAAREAEVGRLRASLDRLLNSRSWRYTTLLRRILERIKRDSPLQSAHDRTKN